MPFIAEVKPFHPIRTFLFHALMWTVAFVGAGAIGIVGFASYVGLI